MAPTPRRYSQSPPTPLFISARTSTIGPQRKKARPSHSDALRARGRQRAEFDATSTFHEDGRCFPVVCAVEQGY